MRKKRYGVRATEYDVRDWRQENVEIAIRREAKDVSFTPGIRYIVLEKYIKNRDELGVEKAKEMAYEKARERNKAYSPQIVDMWIREYEEKGFKGFESKKQGDDDAR